MAPLTLIVELLFGAVFIGALVRLVRGRDPLAGDVTLVFSGLAAVLVAGLIEPFAGPLGDAVGWRRTCRHRRVGTAAMRSRRQ